MNAVRNVCASTRSAARGVDEGDGSPNTTPVSAYRGPGGGGDYYMERLCDERRARWHRPLRDPAAQPLKLPRSVQERRAMTVDSGDFRHDFEKALAAGDVKVLPKKNPIKGHGAKIARAGVGSYMEVTAPPTRRWAASGSRTKAA